MSNKINLQQLVESFVGNTDNSAKDNIIADIIKSINTTSAILPLIIVLGKFLTSSDSSTSTKQRQDAIIIIYETLKNCPNLQLKITELKTIVTFLLSRFEHDLTCQSYIILTTCVLYNKYHNNLCTHNNGELLIQLLSTIINKLDYEQIKLKIKYKDKSTLNYNQLSREQLLKLFNHSLNNYTNIIIKHLTTDDIFITGCIQLID
eukprot:395101_1